MQKCAHFIGIAGVGMSATAMLLRENGWRVTGSDENCYPPISEYLARENIEVRTPYAPTNIPEHVDLIVIGKNAKLTLENPEVRAAHARGISIKNFAEVLGEMLIHRKPIVVAGSFGKSTMTALIAWILIHAGKDPGYMVGAVVHDLPRTSHIGSHPTFVVEGDEYPSGHDDARAKFLHYHARDLVLTSLAHDHVNVFPTHASYLAPFRELVVSLPEDALIVACTDDPHTAKLLVALERTYISYGLKNHPLWSARAISYHEHGASFTLTHGGNDVVRIETALLGAHNVQNIVGAAAFLIEKGLVVPEEIAAAIAHFRGVTRRLDLKTTHSSIPAYEGFGSSYDKAKTAIGALRLHFPKRRLIVVFEPHTFSWRNRAMLHWYDSVFKGVRRVLVYPPGTHGAATHDQATLDEILERIRHAGVDAVSVRSLQEAIATLEETLRPDDVVLLLTSGDMDGLVRDIPLWLDATYENGK